MASNTITKKTTKNNNCILYKNYIYNKKGALNKDSSQRYACKQEGCTASITMLNDQVIKINGNLNLDVDIQTCHKSNHGPLTDNELKKMDFMTNLKETWQQQTTTTTVNQLYQLERTKVIKELGDMNLTSEVVPQLYNIQSALYKQKAKTVPPIPDSIENIVIPDDYKLCEDGKRRFLLHQSKEMFIFCSDDGLKILSKSKRWQSDGTFSTTPDGFKQFYLIHGLYKDQMIPCVFALLSGKSEALYNKLILELKEAALNI